MLALATSGDEVEVRHRAGDEITRSFTFSSELALESMQMIVDGQEMPGPGIDMEQEMTTELEIVLHDTIEEVDGDRASKLGRTYEKLSSRNSFYMTDPMGGEEDHEGTMTSDLEGHTLVFTSVDGEYEASFAEGEAADEELLEGLIALIDLDEFLPEDPVDEGDQWKVDPEVIFALSMPGGDLHLRPEDGDDSGHLQGGGEAGLPEDDAETDGEVVAKYLGIREEDGLRLAAIEITVDVSLSVDLTESLQAMDEHLPEDLPDDMVMPEIESAEQETSRTGEGLLLWNVEKGRLHSLELSCNVTERQMMTMIMSMGDMEQTMEQITEMVGTETYEVSFDG